MILVHVPSLLQAPYPPKKYLGIAYHSRYPNILNDYPRSHPQPLKPIPLSPLPRLIRPNNILPIPHNNRPVLLPQPLPTDHRPPQPLQSLPLPLITIPSPPPKEPPPKPSPLSSKTLGPYPHRK